MADHIKKLFSWLLNVIAVVSAGLIVWQITHKVVDRERAGSPAPRVGSTVRVPGLRLSTERPSAILALSVSCPYCRASAGFYRTLLSTARRGSVQVIPVLLDGKEPDASHLSVLGLSAADGVIYRDLRALDVSATPTILLVGKDSRVAQTWGGKLNSIQESEVFRALGLPYASSRAEETPSDPGGSFLSAEELKGMLQSRDFVVVDARDREQFRQAHVRGALSIPLDEFVTRAPHEVPSSQTVAIICPAISACDAARREEGVASFCDMTKTVVADWAGFRKARLVPGDLCGLRAKGIAVDGDPR